jgi:hypothetical protein
MWKDNLGKGFTICMLFSMLLNTIIIVFEKYLISKGNIKKLINMKDDIKLKSMHR